MASISAGDLRERIGVLALQFQEDDNQYQWTETRRLWADAELDTRSNLFSSVGIGARGVTFTVRRNRELSLHQAFSWHDQHCFLTAILPHDHPGYLTVKAALCSPVVCQKDMDQDPVGVRFPGVLTEKYVGHDQPDLHSEVTTDYVLVVPKIIQLAPGSVVLAGEKHYRVRIPHLLDAYKNEYEIRRVEDC